MSDPQTAEMIRNAAVCAGNFMNFMVFHVLSEAVIKFTIDTFDPGQSKEAPSGKVANLLRMDFVPVDILQPDRYMGVQSCE